MADDGLGGARGVSHDAPEVIVVDTRRVSCDGGGGPLGHPLVYYDVGEDGVVVCGYCGRRYILRGGPADPTATS